MDWFAFVKGHYDANRYGKGDVAVFVVGKKITPAQYEQITGDVYEN